MSTPRLLSLVVPVALAILLIAPAASAQTTNDIGQLKTSQEELRRQYIAAHEAGDAARKKQIVQQMEALNYEPPKDSELGGGNPGQTGQPGGQPGSTGQFPPFIGPLLPGPQDPGLGPGVNNPGQTGQTGNNPGQTGGNNPGQTGGNNPGQTGGNPGQTGGNPAGTGGTNPGTGTGPSPDQTAGQSPEGKKPEKPKSVLDGLKVGGGTNWSHPGRPFGTNPDGSNKYERSGSRVYRRGEDPENKSEDPFKAPDSVKDRVEVGIDYEIHKKDRELKKYETETAQDYADRKDLAKGRAGVRFGTLDTVVTGGAKWNPGTGEVFVGGGAGATVTAISGEAEGQLGNDYAAVKGKASGSILKAEAKIDAKIGNSKDFAGAKVEAGIGGSVAEGTISGTVGSNWLGINVTGEASGSVLTAEAKGVASAGYNKKTGKFEIEVGGKIGALLLGGGAKVKIELNKPGWWPW